MKAAPWDQIRFFVDADDIQKIILLTIFTSELEQLHIRNVEEILGWDKYLHGEGVWKYQDLYAYFFSKSLLMLSRFSNIIL